MDTAPEPAAQKTKGEKAFAFLTKKFQSHEHFTLDEFVAASGYTSNTILNYVSKQWYWFIEQLPTEKYRIKEAFHRHTRETFLSNLSQKRPRPRSSAQFALRIRQEEIPWCVILLSALWWKQASRKFHINILGIVFPL